MRYLALLLLSLLLASCAGVNVSTDMETPPETPTAFDTWQVDSNRQNAAVRQLVDQSDRLIDRGQLSDAEVVLNRSLRIDNRIASVWSRLAWLSLEQANFRRVRDYVSKSNSLTSDERLLELNWQLYRDASMRIGDDAGVRRAEQKLESLQ